MPAWTRSPAARIFQKDGPDAAVSSAGCTTDCCGSAPSLGLAPKMPVVAGATRYRIATMDCSAEESEIRRALDPIAGITNLRFDLGQRVLTIAAAPEVLPAAVAAIRRVGFDPQPTTESLAAGLSGSAHANDHEHGDEHEHENSTFGAGIGRLVLALALAIGADALSFFAPDTVAFKGVGMALSLAAIALADDTYRKGLGALRHGRLNINALMAVPRCQRGCRCIRSIRRPIRNRSERCLTNPKDPLIIEGYVETDQRAAKALTERWGEVL